jgi:hypothetical protein
MEGRRDGTEGRRDRGTEGLMEGGMEDRGTEGLMNGRKEGQRDGGTTEASTYMRRE